MGAEAEGLSGKGPWALLTAPTPMSQGVIQGTVPYLGTFLTDLVMLDTAMKDYLYVSEPRGGGRAGPEAREQSAPHGALSSAQAHFVS